MIPLRQEWPESLARRYREAGYWTGETFWEFLQRSAETWPEHTAVTDGQRRWSYQQLLQHAEQASAAFLAAGLNPGDRVVVQLPNVPSLSAWSLVCFEPAWFLYMPYRHTG